ncbi:DNA polymerase III subunit delta [Candidatus Saccharibacteria bacterium RIFCSPHIGHO2_12_FULL_47_16b]|nr:MAG: DNA polymerase III subunit delta [Candidatus Saccharibacteria bacterium RIFCSPHIGHO2_12_FULL_47_16b]
MVISLVGTNSFSLKKRLDELVDSFVKKHGDLALERFDGEEDETQAIADAISNLPFLAKRKMVVVRNGNINKDFADRIEQIISSTPEWCGLVLYEPQIDRRTNYFKVLKSQTEYKEFNELDVHGLAKWLVEQAKKDSGELSFADANYLVQRLGTNQTLLYNELQKLLTYNRKITRQTIDELTEATPQSRIFELLNAAFSDQKQKALRLYGEQRAQKVEPQEVLAMIVWQLRLIALAKYAGQKSPAQISKDSGASEYPLKSAKTLAERVTEEKLQQLVDYILELDLKAKTTSLDLDEALKTYIVTI